MCICVLPCCGVKEKVEQKPVEPAQVAPVSVESAPAEPLAVEPVKEDAVSDEVVRGHSVCMQSFSNLHSTSKHRKVYSNM